MVDIRVPSTVCLPRLKHLELNNITFVDNESTVKLLSHPLLEELIISDCLWGDDVMAVNVNSPNLRILRIDDPDWLEIDLHDSPQTRQVCFFGDNLKYFRCKSSVPFQYCICSSTMQLTEAQLLDYNTNLVNMFYPNSMTEDMVVQFKRYYKLVNSLSTTVQNLTLSDRTVMIMSQNVLEDSLDLKIPVFEHVTRLNITSDYSGISIDRKWYRMIFKRCPHLEHLTFMKELRCYPAKEYYPVLSPVPSCFHPHLKKITIHCYGLEGIHVQSDAIDILLRGASILEEMVLYWHLEDYILKSDHSSQVEEVEHELNTRPKASENCRVSIVVVYHQSSSMDYLLNYM